MGLTLFKHNLDAYMAALSMLDETGKAAIIHPTGTGKSFIGFQLCEGHPESRICWLSPSEYIFQTQLENLKASGAKEPGNIEFYTYAKLMYLCDEDFKSIRPDYIILDEFHRCGAAEWGRGVDTLLRQYPQAQKLGLSATNIRYLDNQRDMADELFDGNIASEMTLGEAIVRGILLPPKYVISIYAYQKDLEHYQHRVDGAKSKAVRDAAQVYLDKLRRAIEQADGLATVFQKHMTDRHGKYIVFCANVAHLNEMVAHVPEWFSGVDTAPHIYKAYCDDPGTSDAFADFKADDSAHLKLLFCIDMLNEGVHVDDISGVILFRPTVSPIIYKQQIGRALSASKAKEPIILDVVNNFENLYSIGALQEEMQVAINYYRLLGQNYMVVNEHFTIMDEVRDCKGIFDELTESLSASWDLMFSHAKKYYEEHGDLLPVQSYRTTEGYSLGQWLNTQRMVRKGVSGGKLSPERVEKLDSVGMVWDNRNDFEWNRRYAALMDYHKDFGNINVPYQYITGDGIFLGKWLSHIRLYKNANIRNQILTDEREAQLNALGMIWHTVNYYWEQNYLAAVAFYLEHGHLRIPSGYKSKGGLGIGAWISNMRFTKGEGLTDRQRRRMDEIGMCWGSIHDERWELGFEHAVGYFNVHGDLNASYSYQSDDGFNLGLWLSRQRKKLSGDSLTQDQQEKRRRLDSISMVWKKRGNDWESSLAVAKEYFAKFGNINIRKSLVYHELWLGEWIIRQRKLYREHKLSEEQVAQLNALHMDWDMAASGRWNATYDRLKEEYKATGALRSQDKSLNTWLVRQRKGYREGKLTKEQIKLLEEIGMAWNSPRVGQRALGQGAAGGHYITTSHLNEHRYLGATAK